METTRQYWQHAQSGEVWAVELNREGIVLRARGPLHFVGMDRCYDYPLFLEATLLTRQYAKWVNQHSEEFRLASFSPDLGFSHREEEPIAQCLVCGDPMPPADVAMICAPCMAWRKGQRDRSIMEKARS